MNLRLHSKKIIGALGVVLVLLLVIRSLANPKKNSTKPETQAPVVSIQDFHSNTEQETPAPTWDLKQFTSEFQTTPIESPQTTIQKKLTQNTNTPPATAPGTITKPLQKPTNPTKIEPKTKTVAPRPVIDSISRSKFGNGETVTLTGKNFTTNNTVLVSIDLPKSFTSIPSLDTTTLSFTPRFTISNSIARNLRRLPAATKQAAIANIIRIQSSKTGIPGGWYIPATISVKNEGGTSAPISVYINLISGM